MEEKMTFKVVNDEGKEVECEVLFTFESDETNKHYIAYTDNTTDEEGNIKVYASIYNPEEEKFILDKHKSLATISEALDTSVSIYFTPNVS